MKNYKSYIIIVWGILFYISLLAQPSYRPIFEIREKLLKNNLTKQQKCNLYILLAYRYSSTPKLDSADYFYNLFKLDSCVVKGKYLGYEYTYLGLLKIRRSEYLESLKYLRKAANEFYATQDMRDYYLNLINKGIDLNRIDSSQKAIEITLKTKEYFKNNPYTLSKIYLNVGDYYINLSQYDSAISYLYKAYQLKEQLKDTFGLDILSTNLFTCHFNLKEYDKAKEYAKLNVLYAKKLNDTLGIALGYFELAQIYSINNQVDSAIYYYDKAKSLFFKIKMMDYYIKALVEEGIEYSKKDKNMAIKKLDSALYLAKSYNFNSNLAYIYQNLADVYFSIKNYNKAIFYFKKAETYYKKFNYLNNRIKNLYGIAESYKELGKYDSAYFYINQAFKLKDSLFNQQKLNAIKEAESKFQNQKLKLENKIKEQKLAAESRQKRLILLISVVALITLLLVFSFIFYHYKNKRDKELLQLHIQSEDQIRREISSTLHNEVGGKLAAVILKLQEKNDKKLEGEINALKEIYETIRSKSHILAIPSFIQTSLEEELQDLAAIYQTYNVKVNIDIYSKKGWKDVHPFIQQNIYRIVQELLTNSLKHSQADNIELQIVRDGKQIVIMFNDNGIGYDKKTVKYGHGFKNEILNRVKVLNAEFVDNTRKGKGVDIIVKIITSSVNYF